MAMKFCFSNKTFLLVEIINENDGIELYSTLLMRCLGKVFWKKFEAFFKNGYNLASNIRWHFILGAYVCFQLQYCASISTYLCHKDRQNGRMPNDRYLIEFQVEMTPNFFVCSSFDSRLKRNWAYIKVPKELSILYFT